MLEAGRCGYIPGVSLRACVRLRAHEPQTVLRSSPIELVFSLGRGSPLILRCEFRVVMSLFLGLCIAALGNRGHRCREW